MLTDFWFHLGKNWKCLITYLFWFNNKRYNAI